MDLKKIEDGIVRAARHAGRIMLEARNIGSQTHEKGGHANFVTDYDNRVQEYLFAELHRLVPQARMIGEEEGADAFSDTDGFAFCVDPIDGTLNFVKAYRPSVTSIALLEDGKPLIGVVYNPYADLMFTAIRGQGAFVNERPIVSSDDDLAHSLVTFGTSPYHPELSERSFALAAQYLRRGTDLRRSGSAAWDLCAMAMGTTGLFFELDLSIWDYAAGALIASEAGCRLTRIDGSPLTYTRSTSMLCASRGVAKEDYMPE